MREKHEKRGIKGGRERERERVTKNLHNLKIGLLAKVYNLFKAC